MSNNTHYVTLQAFCNKAYFLFPKCKNIQLTFGYFSECGGKKNNRDYAYTSFMIEFHCSPHFEDASQFTAEVLFQVLGGPNYIITLLETFMTILSFKSKDCFPAEGNDTTNYTYMMEFSASKMVHPHTFYF